MGKGTFLPFSYKRFKKEFREVEKEYDRLAKKCHATGPLDEGTRRLVKLGIAIGSESEGAVKSHSRRALAIGISQEEIRHTILLGLTTIGFPKMIGTGPMRPWKKVKAKKEMRTNKGGSCYA